MSYEVNLGGRVTEHTNLYSVVAVVLLDNFERYPELANQPSLKDRLGPSSGKITVLHLPGAPNASKSCVNPSSRSGDINERTTARVRGSAHYQGSRGGSTMSSRYSLLGRADAVQGKKRQCRSRTLASSSSNITERWMGSSKETQSR